MTKYTPVPAKNRRFSVLSLLADPRPIVQLPTDPKLPPPVAPDTLPDLDEPGYFLLPVAIADDALKVQVPWWPDISNDLALRPLWNGTAQDTYHEITPAEVNDPTTVFEFEIPASVMAASPTGQYALQYVTAIPPFYVNEAYSISTTVIVDRRAPGGELLPTLQFDEGVRDGVTVDDLDVNGNLEAIVADYYEMKIEDLVTPWIGSADGSTGEYIDANAVPVDDDDVGTNKVHIFFPRTLLEKYGDGPVGFKYKVRDRAGNDTANTVPDPVPIEVLDVLLKTAPGTLFPPLVPAYDDGLVTNDDAMAPGGVVVQIPKYDNAAGGDIITVHWVGAPPVSVPFRPLTDAETLLDPMIDIPITRAQLISAGDGDVNVSYTVRRGNNTFPPSSITPVKVDMSIPGGPDPDPGTPENENLKAPVVTSFSGDTDHIPKADYLRQNTVTIPWQTVDNRQAMFTNDRLVVTWGTATPIRLTLVAGQVTSDLILNIPLPTIPGEGAGLKNVQYSLTRALSVAPHESTALSPVKEVLVESDVGFPGDGLPLAPPTLPEARRQTGGPLFIDRAAGLDGTPVRCPTTDTNIAAGDTVQLMFVGYTNFDGTGAEIPETKHTPTQLLTQAEIAQGYADIEVPANIMRKLCRGSVKPTYKVTNSTGTNGSLPSEVVVVILYNGGDPNCQL